MHSVSYTAIQQVGRYWSTAMAVFCLLLVNKSMAVGSIELTIEQLLLPLKVDNVKQPNSHSLSQQLFKQLQLDKLALKIDLAASPTKIIIALEQLNLPQPFSDLRELSISCLSLTLQADQIACTQGTIAIKGLLDEFLTSADFNIKYLSNQQDMSIVINNMDIGHGRFGLDIQLKNNQWLMKFKGDNIAYHSLKKFVHHYFQESLQSYNELGVSVSFIGQLSGKLPGHVIDNSGTVHDDSLWFNSMDLKGRINNLHYDSDDDIAENLGLNFMIKLKNTDKDSYHLSALLNNISGELFQNDIYLSFTGNEQLKLSAIYHDRDQAIVLQQLSIVIPGIVTAKSSGQISLKKSSNVYNLQSTFSFNDLDRFNELYLNNILDGSDYEGLTMQGTLQADVKYNGQLSAFNAQFNELSVSFNELSMLNAHGQFYWNNYKQSFDKMAKSHLSWQALKLNHLPLGPTQLQFKAQGDRLKLLQETEIPVFDGFLHINSLELTQIGQKSEDNSRNTGLNIAVDGMIKPISLDIVSKHFGWPLLDGKLSAVIPYTTYNEHLLEVGGALMMQVFGGVIIAKDLQIEHPLSDNARLSTNIDLNNIDLQSLTKTYDFGEIEGRVEGKFAQLQLDGWQPIAFDGYIRTPVNDRSNHRISQRAIDNLSSLGGASGILSRSFLSFFETFRYDKLGISCKLKNNICKMNGIESSSDGKSYYIVKGGGIPRIDVMGFQHQVNWQVLTSRLKAIQSANQAVIE